MLGGQGIGLPPPQGLWYPLPINQAYQPQGSAFEVQAGDALYVPPGWWLVRTGSYTQIQWLDPVSGAWIPITSIGPSYYILNSDGANHRIINPTGLPVGALVTNVGSAYVQANTTVTANTGGSTWRAIVGGALTAITVGNDPAGTAGGSNFTLPPIVDIPAPPAGGVQATATATVTSNAIASVTLINQGAGYLAAPTPVIRPNPFDVNIGSITVPALTSTLGGAGQIAAILPVNPGAVQTGSAMGSTTLTIAGSGSSATATPLFAMTITGVALSSSGGAGYSGTAAQIAALPSAVVGTPGAIVNPAIANKLFIPREALIASPVSGGVVGAAIITDGGLYMVAPTPMVLSQAGTAAPGTATSATLTMGSASDTVFLQALGGAF
jgi:hypothetical protein